MKHLLLIVILFLSLNCFGQTFTLIAKSYYILSDGKSKKVNKVMALTYSRNYSSLYIEGEKNTSFTNEQYTNNLLNGYTHENYLSGETVTTLYGHYSINVDKMKDNNAVTVGSFTTGVTYYAEHAQLYSEVGKVIHNPYVNNWKELLENEKKQIILSKQKDDSIKNIMIQEKIKDSIELIKNDSIKKVEAENRLLSGDNYNWLVDRSTEDLLESIIQKNVQLKVGEMIYSKWLIKIDKEGVIIDAYPDENYKGGHIINSYILSINNALINQRVKPYVNKNGNKYPSYANVNITLIYIAKEEKKRLKLKDALKVLPLGSFF